MNKYDQLLQGVKTFDNQLDTIPTRNEVELDNRIEVYEYYHKMAAQLHDELTEQLQNAQGKPREAQRISTLIQKIADADRILVEVEGKIDSITTRLFPQTHVESPSHQEKKKRPADNLDTGSMASQSSLPPPDRVTIQAADFAERVESFRQGLFLQQQEQNGELTKEQQIECTQIVNQFRKELSALKAMIKKNAPKDQMVIKLLNELMATAEGTLNGINRETKGISNAGISSSNSQRTQARKRTILALGSRADSGSLRVISSPWYYTERGRSIAPNLGRNNYIQQGIQDGTIEAPNQFYQWTQGLSDVLGDGCCGYYSYAALLIQKAIDDPRFKDRILNQIANVCELWDPGTDEAPFQDGDEVRAVSKRELIAQVTAIFRSLNQGSNVNDVLTKENGQLLNIFFRVALREGMNTGVLDDYLPAFNESDAGEEPLSAGFTQQYTEIVDPIVLALNELLNVNIKIIRLQDNTLIMPEEQSNDGYILHTGGHYMAAFPRLEVRGGRT